MILDIHDRVELIMLGLWVLCIIGIGVLSRIHFKTKKLEQFRITANKLMESYANFYIKEDLSEEKKINRVTNAVLDELEAKGFKVNEQEMEEIFNDVEKIVTEMAREEN